MNVPAAPPVAPVAPIVPGVPLTGTVSTSTPNNTIYVNNLNEKIKRDDLKKSLYAVFVQFGKIVDIVTAKNLKMRGQAFVVFDDISAASTALRAMQGFPLYEKPMRIQFARKDSDVIAKRKGTFIPRAYHVAAQNGNMEAAAAMDTNGGLSARAIRRRQQRLAASSTTDNSAETTAANPAPVPINPATIPDQPPNKILFVTNLPEDSNEAMIRTLFEQFVGFREVRMVPQRHDIAFVEFINELEAGTAKQGLQGFNIKPGKPIRITFAKK